MTITDAFIVDSDPEDVRQNTTILLARQPSPDIFFGFRPRAFFWNPARGIPVCAPFCDESTRSHSRTHSWDHLAARRMAQEVKSRVRRCVGADRLSNSRVPVYATGVRKSVRAPKDHATPKRHNIQIRRRSRALHSSGTLGMNWTRSHRAVLPADADERERGTR